MDDFAVFMAQRLACRLAALVEGSELAIFRVNTQESGEGRLRLFTHIRSTERSSEAQAQAIAAFREMAQRTVDLNRSAYYKCGGDDHWCLLTLFKVDGILHAAAGIVVRAKEESAVVRMMRIIEGHLEMR